MMLKFDVGVLDLNRGYKGHPDLWAESLHTQSIGVQASKRWITGLIVYVHMYIMYM